MAGLMDIRRRMMMRGNTLPPAYTKCDYVQSMGAKAKIDTGVSGDDTSLQFAGDITILDFSRYFAIFGNHKTDDYKAWRIIHPSADTYNNLLFGTYKSLSTGVSVPIGSLQNLPLRFQLLMRYGYVELTVNGTTQTVTVQNGDSRPVNDTNIAIGARNPTATSSFDVRHRFYSFKIWRQNILIRDYHPCIRRSDNKAGFYDTVNHTFNPSTGAEEFIAGND